ncbi:hypothetical protein FN846DRAFT_996557 [Sphaerosporella brunnea]|uniref:Protein kinase domain-containing protein n=1 Tax=Sphaerosporella brunnea TaxID=1250544 RepID=A0A5J5F6L3_9PEZI|nr:hypothetical protein FN846DRAFT_996557 [Sphaerosporella brunnea]
MSVPDSSDTPADDVFASLEVNHSLEDPVRYQPEGYHPIAPPSPTRETGRHSFALGTSRRPTRPKTHGLCGNFGLGSAAEEYRSEDRGAEALVSLHSQGIVHADFHTRNISFALTVDIHGWSVEEVYEALGHPITVSMHEALECASDPAPQSSQISAHQPHSSPSNIRLIDFTESFAMPFSFSEEMGQLPGTPCSVAAPELLLRLSSEVTPAIDVWALGCVIYRVVSDDSPFGGLNGPLGDYLARIMLSLGGETSIPGRFMDAFRECGTMTWAQWPGRDESNWDEKFTRSREDPVEALGQEDETVLRKVVGTSLLIDARERASAAEILALLLQGWPNI